MIPAAAASHPPLVILGSARKASDTRRLVNQLFEQTEIQLLDLLDYSLHHYSYTGKYPADDSFQQLVQQLLLHDQIIFATPVYWYSMSGHMKVFFDRLTDLVTIHKTQGRQLKGKKMLVVATGNNADLPTGFEIPFQQTAAYLDMHYLGCYYCSSDALTAPKICTSKQKLKQLLQQLPGYNKQ